MSFCPGSWTAPRFSLKVKDIPACLGLQRSSVVRGFVRNQGPACTSDRKYSLLLILKLEQKVALTNKTKLQILASFHKFQRSLRYHSSKTLKLFHDKMVVGREKIMLVWNRELQNTGCANLKWVHFFSMTLGNYVPGKSRSFHCIRSYMRIVWLNSLVEVIITQTFSLLATSKEVSILTRIATIFTPDSTHRPFVVVHLVFWGNVKKKKN